MLPATVDGAGTHPPGPANRDRPTVLSRQRRKLSKVGAMSPVVRQELPTCSVKASICTQPAFEAAAQTTTADALLTSPLQMPSILG